ncbi:hypothetical protein LTR37_017260 [Vermiconidia calcicola]|uniref:Uncharacterized protein n=1 Tax=Vermiconidia calcicola TaxID=1690605 RepID=A0ACC3MKI0_9PEZI|nr:hypothetical protein LTR37_017260 [Vermiconidia calcicola]
MSSYFFHLKLELYTGPAASKGRLAKHANNSTPYIPSGGVTDIFKSPLPAHKTSKWSSYTFSKRPGTPHTNSNSGSEPSGSPHRPPPPSDFTESHGDTLLLPERTSNRKGLSKSPAPAFAKPSNEAAAKDYRYDAVSIESIDMEVSRTRGSAHPVKSGASGQHTKAVYIPSDPKTTEVGWGVVHLYRDAEESSHLGDATMGRRKSLDRITRAQENAGEQFDPEECTTLCILAVPSWMMPSDLLGFVGDQAREDVSHFRLIRTGRANKYMVLMKFRAAKKAKEWQKAYNGRLFSAAEPENCHVVFIKSVEFLSPGEDEVAEEGKSFPQNNHHDPFTPVYAPSSRTEKSISSKPLAPPPPNLLELPTCPVCLERMDETTGLLTILCQHVFHCACLEKWRFPGSGCPVCRYTQSPSYTFPYPRPSSHSATGEDEAEPMCSTCAANDNVNLWICLICGNIGCGRYDSAHAYAHYEATSHCYAMDISTQHVWDYAGDGYVHRLIQSKPDFSSQSKHNGASGQAGHIDVGGTRARHENEAYRAEGEDMVPREKMESMANEYTYLLTSQLEGQRRYFEEQVERAVDKASEASAKAEAAASQATKATAELDNSKSKREALQASLQRFERSFEKSEKARSKFEQMARDMSSQLREEKMINSGLLERIKAADQKAEDAKKVAEKAREEKKELEEMNHDLTMFISSQEKVKELQAQGEEVVDGSVSLPEQKAQGGKKGKGRKK